MRPTPAILLTLALAAAAVAQPSPPTTQAADGAELFDPATFPRNGDLSELTPEQRKAVLDARKAAVRAGGPGGWQRGPAEAIDSAPDPAPTPDATTQPGGEAAASDVAARVAQLDDRDPEVRQAAREALMSLTRDDLPRLRDAVAGTAPRAGVRDALRDVVLHVYLTGKHRFRGAATPIIGIIATPESGEPPTILARTIGYDAYRALRDGDVIVALRVPPRRREGEGTFAPIRSLVTLRELLGGASVGQWVGVRVLRAGAAEPVETRVRIGPQTPVLANTRGVNPFLAEAETYWTKEFAPALATTTRPTDRGT